MEAHRVTSRRHSLVAIGEVGHKLDVRLLNLRLNGHCENVDNDLARLEVGERMPTCRERGIRGARDHRQTDGHVSPGCEVPPP